MRQKKFENTGKERKMERRGQKRMEKINRGGQSLSRAVEPKKKK